MRHWMCAATCVVVMMSIVSDSFAADEPQPLASDLAIEASASAVLPVWPTELPPLTEGVTSERVVVRLRDNGDRDRGVYDVVQPTISVFLPDEKPRDGGAWPAIVVCPGGGYERVVLDREGYRIADWLRKAGVAAIVLKYRLPVGEAPKDGALPPPIVDGVRAMRLVRAHAAEWNIDPQRVGIMGFSAGGSLAGNVMVWGDEGDASAVDGVERESARPDFVVLVYPVASMRPGLTHGGSHDRLLGVSAETAMEARFSVAEHVDARTPAMFLVHAADDGGVPIANSEGLMAAAQAAGVPVEMVRLEQGGHGFFLGSAENGTDVWRARCVAWLRGRGVLEAAGE